MKARRVPKLDPGAPLSENTARIVRVRLDELRSFAPRALDPGEQATQHDMRIAAKRLRYVLEATGFCLGEPADPARRRARDLQDLLGDIHDCDLMLPRVHEHVARLQDDDVDEICRRAGDAPDLDPSIVAIAHHRTAYRGLEMLGLHLRARRRLLFDRFRRFWLKQEQAGTWTALDDAARDELKRAKARRKAARAAERARLLQLEGERLDPLQPTEPMWRQPGAHRDPAAD